MTKEEIYPSLQIFVLNIFSFIFILIKVTVDLKPPKEESLKLSRSRSGGHRVSSEELPINPVCCNTSRALRVSK